MHLLFIDESGNPPPPQKRSATAHFVLGGVIIPEEIWPRLANDLKRIKTQYKVVGEIKWRYFAFGNKDSGNPLLHLSASERDELRGKLFESLSAYKSIRIISVVADIQRCYEGPIKSEVELYHRAYNILSERFQYFLQDMERLSGQNINGLVICDPRDGQNDEKLRELHQKLLHGSGKHMSSYGNLIEGLFLAPSHHSVGIQFADMIAGAIFRRYEKQDSRFFDIIRSNIRTSPRGSIEGYGIAFIPTHK